MGVADWEWRAPSQLAAWWMEVVRAVLVWFTIASACTMLAVSCNKQLAMVSKPRDPDAL